MRSIVWATSLTLVASSLATVAVVDYGQRHPESATGKLLARLKGESSPALAKAEPAPVVIQPIEPEDRKGDSSASSDLLQDLKILSAQPPPEAMSAAASEAAEPLAKPSPAFVKKQPLAANPLWLAVRLASDWIDAWLSDGVACLRRLDRAIALTRNQQSEPPPSVPCEPVSVVMLPASPQEQKPTLEAMIYFKYTPAQRPESEAAPPTSLEATPPSCDESRDPCGCCRAACVGRATSTPCVEEDRCGRDRTLPPCCRSVEQPELAESEPPLLVASPLVIPLFIPVKGASATPHLAPAASPVLKPLTTRFYHVDDLITEEHGQGELLDLVRRMVEPETWAKPLALALGEPTGRGEISYYSQGRTLIVRQTADVHEQLQWFLSRMRSEAALRGKSPAPIRAAEGPPRLPAAAEREFGRIPTFELEFPEAEPLLQVSFELLPAIEEEPTAVDPWALRFDALAEQLARPTEPLAFAPESVTMETPPFIDWR